MPGPQQGPTGVIVVTPWYQSGPRFFNLLDVTWDPGFYGGREPDGTVVGTGFSTGVFLDAGDLSVTSLGFAGSGTVVDTVFGQSNDPQGIIYWEITWTALPDTSLVGGIGVCTFDALNISGSSLSGSYDTIAKTGQLSVILRPDGTVWWDQGPALKQNGQQFFQPQQQGDTIGILVNFRDSRFIGVNFYGVGGSILGAIAGTFQIVAPGKNIVPCAIFDGGNRGYTARALFSRSNQNAFLLPNTNFYPGIVLVAGDAGPAPGILGWPPIA